MDADQEQTSVQGSSPLYRIYSQQYLYYYDYESDLGVDCPDRQWLFHRDQFQFCDHKVSEIGTVFMYAGGMIFHRFPAPENRLGTILDNYLLIYVFWTIGVHDEVLKM